jgi:thiol-disulfide isomerase/thioredoxin
MFCPKCGFEQPPALECARCGLIFAKFRPPSGATPVPLPAAMPPGAPRRSRAARWLSAILLVALCAAGYGLWRSEASSVEAPPETEETAGAPADVLEGALAETAAAPEEPPLLAPPTPVGPAGAGRSPPPAARAPSPARAAVQTCAAFHRLLTEGEPLPRIGRASAAWYVGAEGFDRAEREQRETRAPMVAFVYTNWCPHCRRFLAGILENGTTRRFLEPFVKVKVNPETGPQERALASRLGAKGYPTFLVFPGAGDLPRKVGTHRREGAGWRLRTPEEFNAAVTAAVAADAAGRMARAAALRGAGDHAAAVAELDRVLARFPRYAEAYYWRGVARTQRGDREEAVADLQRAIALRADYAEAYDYLGYLGLVLGCADAAIVYLSKLVELDAAGRKARALFWRGIAYSRRGEIASARADYQSACALGLAQACERGGRVQ